MIDIVFSLTQFEIYDVDGIDLTNLVVGIPLTDIFCNGFRYPIEHTMKISYLMTILNLNNNQFTLIIFCQYIDTIILV